MIAVTLEPLKMSPTMYAEYCSTLVPIVKSFKQYRQNVCRHLYNIRGRWRVCVCKLRAAGWEAIATKKFGYALNCPPCSARLSVRTQPCRLRICPFCHARHVAKVYTQFKNKLERCGGGTVVSFRQYAGHELLSPDKVIFDSLGGLEGTLCKNVLPRHVKMRNEFRAKYMQEALGGVYWHSLAPLAFDEPAPDGSTGRWMSLHSCVAIMPKEYKLKANRYWRAITNPSPYKLASLVGRAFQYRAYWLTADTTTMSEFLNVTKGVRFSVPFGCFKQ